MANIPGIEAIISVNPVNIDPKNGGFTSAGDIISQALEVGFAIAALVAFFYAMWGVYQYIFAGGNKEGLGKARARITWAIVGLVILGMAFAISQFLETFFVTQPGKVTEVTEPSAQQPTATQTEPEPNPANPTR